MTRILVNGRAGGTVDPLDRGLHYGDGLFETIAIVGGRPRFIDWHFERLGGGARALGFPSPDLDALRADIAVVATEPRCVVKLVLTRGAGERGYRPPRDPQPTRIVAAGALAGRAARCGHGGNPARMVPDAPGAERRAGRPQAPQPAGAGPGAGRVG